MTDASDSWSAGGPNDADGVAAAGEPTGSQSSFGGRSGFGGSFGKPAAGQPAAGQPTDGESQAAGAMSDAEVNARIQGLDFTPEGSDFEADEAAAGAAAAASSASAESPALAAAKAESAKHLEAYQRSQADYINLRNRTTKQLETARADGREDVLRALMPVLDQIERARSHDELQGPMVAIAQQIDDVLGRLGFVRFGAVGDEFDPNRHEALMHRSSDDAEAETVEHVIDPGYLNGEKVVRAAKVGVVGPQ